MDLTQKDRLLLINQYKILAELDKNSSTHYQAMISILEEGYEIFYSNAFDWISENMPIEESEFVLSVLDLYRVLDSLIRLSEDQSLINHSYSIFPGFDGNNESRHLGFCRFLINKQGKYQEQTMYFRKNDNMNSHTTMVPKYKGMLKAWSKYGKSFDITTDQALEILSADAL